MLNITDITYRIAGRTLFENTSLIIGKGQRVGLVGPNGVGKSTLFKLIAGELELDGGDISLITGAKMGMVRQDLPDDNTTLLEVVLASDTERSALFAEAETATDPQRIADIFTRLNDIDAYEAPARAATILSGLGFDDTAQNSAIADFSGGWKMRVALAAALFLQPELLLLDEPTNHLDFEALVWLENYLTNYPHTLVIISHDREILNKTVTHIAHLDQCQLTSYTGSYDQFEERRAQKLMNQQALFEKQQAQKKRMMAFVDRFGAKASKARQAQSRLKAIERMDMVDAIIADRSTRFTFPQPEELAASIITLHDVDIGYAPNKPVLKNLNRSITMEDRIALLGANGNGKSTLIKLLSNKLEAMSGEVLRSSKLRVGYFAQHQAEELDLSTSPYQMLKDIMPDKPEAKIRAILGQFGFDKQKADTLIAKLSGGEKARLLFCIMSYNAPHIMLLDEPTNHLDIDARQGLIQALNAYQGCVIIVSHDPHIVECVADQLWLVKDGDVTTYNDDLNAYRQLIIDQRRNERSEAKQEAKKEKKKKAKKEAPSSKNAVQQAETDMERISQRLAQIEADMADDKALDSQSVMSELVTAYAQTQSQLAAAEEKWLKLQEMAS
ncbi:MAG: ABC-F family ATP-binding cassette domain-containing protein [Alphaproteobacteria bacterium]|nr:ABC-F family ATP-binding cassette domain-containing protein [Alphaproteobacteria bacterium]